MRKSLKKIKNSTKQKEQRRKLSIRKKIVGTTDRPRICATKSNANIFVAWTSPQELSKNNSKQEANCQNLIDFPQNLMIYEIKTRV